MQLQSSCVARPRHQACADQALVNSTAVISLKLCTCAGPIFLADWSNRVSFVVLPGAPLAAELASGHQEGPVEEGTEQEQKT